MNENGTFSFLYLFLLECLLVFPVCPVRPSVGLIHRNSRFVYYLAFTHLLWSSPDPYLSSVLVSDGDLDLTTLPSTLGLDRCVSTASMGSLMCSTLQP